MLKKILLVEDDARDLEIELTALEHLGVSERVVTARNGEEALDYLYMRGRHNARLAGDPCVVLLDLKMPKVDGLATLKAIRQTKEFRRLPVVLFTSSEEESDIARSYDLGVNAYLTKPAGFHELQAKLQAVSAFWLDLNTTAD